MDSQPASNLWAHMHMHPTCNRLPRGRYFSSGHHLPCYFPDSETGGRLAGASEEHDAPKKGSPEEPLPKDPAGEEAVSLFDTVWLLSAVLRPTLQIMAVTAPWSWGQSHPVTPAASSSGLSQPCKVQSRMHGEH